MNIPKSSVAFMLTHIYKNFKMKPGPKKIINKRLHLQIKRHVAKSNIDGRVVNCQSVIRDLALQIKRRTINNWFIKNDYRYKKHRQAICIN